jgi:hypothetical protein
VSEENKYFVKKPPRFIDKLFFCRNEQYPKNLYPPWCSRKKEGTKKKFTSELGVKLNVCSKYWEREKNNCKIDFSPSFFMTLIWKVGLTLEVLCSVCATYLSSLNNNFKLKSFYNHFPRGKKYADYTRLLAYVCKHTHSQPARMKYDKGRKPCESFQHKQREQKACVKSL